MKTIIIDGIEYNLTPKLPFKKGDWVVLSISDGEKVVQIDSIKYFKSGEPMYITSEGRWFGNGTKARILTNKDMETITIPERSTIVKKIKSWSEDDEIMIKVFDSIIRYIVEVVDKNVLKRFGTKREELFSWLKSIKQRIGG